MRNLVFGVIGMLVLLLSPSTPCMMKDRYLNPDRCADAGRLSAELVRRWPRIIGVEAVNEVKASNF